MNIMKSITFYITYWL